MMKRETVVTNSFFDDLDELCANAGTEVRGAINAPVSYVAPEPARFLDKCPACAGSGRWRGIRICFKCKGKGNLVFKTSAATRAKARTAIAVKKVKNLETFATEHADVFNWLKSNPNFEFAASLYRQLVQKGDLTDGQLAAAQKCANKAKARVAERAAAATKPAPVIDMRQIETAFSTAKSNGIKRPKLRLADFKFSTAPDTGLNAGAIYVNSGETYLGKVVNGTFKKAYACTTVQEQEILRVAMDAAAESKAYGLRTGSCSCCGRTLTDGRSIDLGIGPICAEKYGF
jgi:hypothetical protein